MSLCPESAERAAMPDEEFWDHVSMRDRGAEDVSGLEFPLDLVQLEVEPCPVCGEQGACAYDAEGRPLIHTDTELPE